MTSGCCTADSGLYYGFALADDPALVERVFRDNLPFALAVISAAGDPATAVGPTGAGPTPPRVESIWPEAWVSLPSAGPVPFTLTARSGTGSIVTRSLSADPLARGTVRTVWRTDLSTDGTRAVRVDGVGFEAELISLAGAEDGEAGWQGWARANDALAGSWSWGTITEDTLTSPAVDLSGRSRVWLQFWTKHRGSTFTPELRGVVQVSADNGATWSDMVAIVGAGPAWYPMRVDLPAVANAQAARVRFVSVGLSWWLDAVGFASDSTGLFAAQPPVASLELSENPVRGPQVVFSWPAGSGAPRVGVYSFTGERLLSATLAPGSTEYVWDLLAGSRRVANGAYLVVLELDGQLSRRRLFVTRP